MTTTLRTILKAHAENSPLVYLSDGGTDWFAGTLADETDAELLDEEETFTTTEQGICRIGEFAYVESIPEYRYRAAWTLADAKEIAIAVPTLDALMDAAKQYGECVGKDALDSDMPTFGGDEPASTDGVWSWDATRLLVGTCAGDLRMALRSDV